MSGVAARLLPGGIVVLGTALALAVPGVDASAAALVPAAPYAVFAAAGLVAWRIRCSRVLLLALILAAADPSLRLTAAAPRAATVAAGVAVLLPPTLAAIAWLPERGPLAARLAWTAGVLSLEAVLVALLCQPEAADAAVGLARPFGVLSSWIGLPRAAVLTTALALVLTLARAIGTHSPLEAGSLWVVVAAALAVNDVRGARPSLMLAGGAVALVVSLVESSYAIAYGDVLTGLPARRALNEALARLDGTYTIAIVDIDHFKRFNDTYGHDVGDELLRMVGARFAAVGGGGCAFRYGGEEFAVIFDGTKAADALPVLEALRSSIESTGFTLRARDRPRSDAGAGVRRRGLTRTVSVSVSIGAAESSRTHTTPRAVVDAADAALYRAKRGGRNRVCT